MLDQSIIRNRSEIGVASHERLLVSVEEARAELGRISRATFYRLLQTGQLKSVRIGRRTFIRSADLRQYVSDLANDAQPAMSP